MLFLTLLGLCNFYYHHPPSLTEPPPKLLRNPASAPWLCHQSQQLDPSGPAQRGPWASTSLSEFPHLQNRVTRVPTPQGCSGASSRLCVGPTVTDRGRVSTIIMSRWQSCKDLRMFCGCLPSPHFSEEETESRGGENTAQVPAINGSTEIAPSVLSLSLYWSAPGKGS